MSLKFIKPERILLSNHSEYREKWVQERIAGDPSILGLGDLVLKDKERSQPRAGRLDLLFQDAELTTRYEVEVMLGSTDENHIIRTIEYWDVERKRYPQYDHYAVIVAEDITSRFLNVVGLFNGFIPLIALQIPTPSSTIPKRRRVASSFRHTIATAREFNEFVERIARVVTWCNTDSEI
jgi:hypothetical protein